MFNFKSLEKSIADIKSQAETLRDDIVEKTKQRDNLKTSPLSRKDLADQVCAMVDKQGSIYIERLAQALTFAHTHPLHNFAENHLDLIGTAGGSVTPGQIPKENMMWFFGDILTQRLRDAIEIMDWPKKCGPPLAKRRAAIEALDKNIEALEKQAADLQAQAAAAGITIPGISALTKREQSIALTERINELIKSTPVPSHVVRGMLANGIDPEAEAAKIPARSLQ